MRRYWNSVAVCFFMAFLVGEYGASTTALRSYNEGWETTQSISRHVTGKSKGETVSEFLYNISAGRIAKSQWLSRISSDATNSQTSTSDTFFFISVDVVNQFFVGKNVNVFVAQGVVSLLSILYVIFIANILRIGECRFFMEKRKYKDTRASRIIYLFRMGKVRGPAWIMFKKWFFNILWLLTIVGGIIKFYEYRLIPYIVAENPDISADKAFKLSKTMMQGQKWKCFVLDLTFVGWEILTIFTIGLVGFFFSNPYRTSTYVEMYMELRNHAKQNQIPDYELLCDQHL
jgi:uncharacterized membrane protein